MAVARRFLALLGLFLLLLPIASAATAAPQPHSSPKTIVAFIHAAVVPMDAEHVLQDQTVIVTNGTITQIAPSAAAKVPRGATRIDATGHYLLPALCDMHVHVEGEAWNALLKPEVQIGTKDVPFETFLFPYVANGVTTIQILSATPDEIPLRERIIRGEVLAPRLILARMVDGPKKAWPPPISTWVATPEEAREAVRQAKAAGYDKIKVYSFLSKECYDAIMATAKELGMDVIGHVPMALSVEYVIDAGQKLIAHTEEIAKHAGADAYTPARIDYFASLMAKSGVWMTPTLVTTRTILQVFDDAEELHSRPEAAYAGPAARGIWSFIEQNLYAKIPDAPRARIRTDFEKFQLPLTKAIYERHGKLMTGTDTLLPGLVPGFALHRELHEFVDVGMTPYEALRTSTTAPFEYLGESDKRGTITVGKQTDMLLIDANPLEDVSAASKISGVLMRGRWIAKDELHKRMEVLAASNKTTP